MRHHATLVALGLAALLAAPAPAQDTPPPANGMPDSLGRRLALEALEEQEAETPGPPQSAPDEPAGPAEEPPEAGPQPAASDGLEEPPAEPAGASPNAALSPVGAERDAFDELRRTGRAPILARPTSRVVPFGRAVPTLLCVPERACDVELEAGEVVDGLALGDSSRWQVEQFFEGEGESLTPHLVFKPTQTGGATNAVIVTSRRTYHLELATPGEEELAGEAPATYLHHLAFWYPEAWARGLRTEAERSAGPQEQSASPEPFSAGALEFGYRIELPSRRSRRLPWKPVAVFDDGVATYVVLPGEARRGELPVVLGRSPDGSYLPLNATLQGDRYVVGRILPQIELVAGAGRHRRWLRIHRMQPGGE